MQLKCRQLTWPEELPELSPEGPGVQSISHAGKGRRNRDRPHRQHDGNNENYRRHDIIVKGRSPQHWNPTPIVANHVLAATAPTDLGLERETRMSPLSP